MKNKLAFSLLEQSLVLAVLSVIVATGAIYADYSDQKNKREETLRRIDIIEKAILDTYLSDSVNSSTSEIVEDAFPCPANPALRHDNANFGRSEETSGACNSSGDITVHSNVYYGIVPVRELGIPYYYGYDAWGRRFSYAVNKSIIADIDADWSSSNLNSKLYHIISHGANQLSSYSRSGVKKIASTDTNEIANSIDATSYANIKDRAHTNSYDDIVVVRTARHFMAQLAGGYIPNSGICSMWNDNSAANGECEALRNKILTICPEGSATIN